MKTFAALVLTAVLVTFAGAGAARADDPPAAHPTLRLVTPGGDVLTERGTNPRVVRTSGHTYVLPGGAAAQDVATRDVGVLDVGTATAAATGPSYPLAIRVVPPDGVTPDATVLFIVNTDDARRYDRGFQLAGTRHTFNVPAGHYTIMADAISAPPPGGGDEKDRFAFRTDVDVTAAGQTAVLDTSRATQSAYPTFDVPWPAVDSLADLFYVVYDDLGHQAFEFELPQYFGLDVRAASARGGQHGLLTSIATTSLDSPATAAQPYGYYLTHAHRNAVVAGEQVTVPSAQLATVQTHYYGDGRNLLGSAGRAPEFPYFDPGEFVAHDIPGAPLVRTESLAGPAGVTWQTSVDEYLADGSADTAEISLPRAFGPGAVYREDWFRGPLAPGAVSQPGLGSSDCQACRSASRMTLGVAPFADSDPTHVGELFGTRIPEEHVTVREDATTVFDGDDAFYGKGAAVFGVSPGEHGYQVIATHNAAADGAVLSTHARTEWDFRASQRSGPGVPTGWTCGGRSSAGCTVLPMLTVSDPLPTSMTGTLPPGRSTVVVSVGHVRGAAPTAVTGLTYAVGVDGQAYVPQQVRPLGHGRFLVTVVTPDAAPGTGLSVRVHAIDAAGGSVTQSGRTAYTVAG